MRFNLRNGKLIEPASLEEAEHRHQQLGHEAQRVEAQLDDPTRVKNYATRDAYFEWRGSAQRALTLFHSERQQISGWIANHLLRKARDLLKTLQNEEVDFDPNELAILARLDAHLDTHKQTIKHPNKEKRA